MFDSSRMKAVHALWDAMAQPPAGSDTRKQLMSELCRLVGADTAVWTALVRLGGSGDRFRGWRFRAMQYLHPNTYEDGGARYQRELDQGQGDEIVVRGLAEVGTFRAYRVRDLVSPAWLKTPAWEQRYVANGVHDLLYLASPVNADLEVTITLFRTVQRPLFTAEERDLGAQAVSALRWLYLRQLLELGLHIASEPVTRMERSVLKGLLAGKSDKEIAASLERSIRTVNAHVAALLAKYGVKTRTELMALWVGATGA